MEEATQPVAEKELPRMQDVKGNIWWLKILWFIAIGANLLFNLVYFYFLPYLFFIGQYMYLMLSDANEKWKPPDNITK